MKRFVLVLALVLWVGAAFALNFGQSLSTGQFNTYRWNDLRVPLSTTKINPAGNPPAFDNFDGLAVGCYQFSGSLLNECFFDAQIPHGVYDSEVDVHVHYSPDTDGALTATMTFGIEYLITAPNQPMALTTTTIEKSVYGVASNTHHLLEIGKIPLAVAFKDSSILACRFYRLGGGTDTYTGICNVFSIDFHYRIAAVGSIGEYGDR